MNKKQEERLAKAFMRRHVYRAEKEGMSEEELTNERRELAEAFGSTLPEVAATTAWLQIRSQRAIAQCLSFSDAVHARDYIALADSQKERILLQHEVAEMLNADVQDIVSVTDGLRNQIEELMNRGGSVSHITEKWNTALGKWKRVPLLGGNEHYDYDTETKEKWRLEWVRFINENTSEQQRKRMNVICLSGKKCELEVHHYLDLGFLPEHIYAVEGGDHLARAEFFMRARKLGIQHFEGKLENFLPSKKTRFDVVSLDFPGQICNSYLQIASQLLLAERSLIMTNTMAHREARETQGDMQDRWDQLQDERGIMTYLDALSGKQHHTSSAENWSIEHARETCPMLNAAGLNRRENWYFGGKMLCMPLLGESATAVKADDRSRLLHSINKALVPITHKMYELLRMHGILHPEKIKEFEGFAFLDDMFRDVAFGNKYVTQLEKRSYESKNRHTRLTYHTDMGVIQTPRHLYEGLGSTVDFLLTCIDHGVRLIKEEQGNETALHRLRFDILRGSEFVRIGEARLTDRIACYQDGRFITAKPIHALINSAVKHHDFRQSSACWSQDKQLEIERTPIV